MDQIWRYINTLAEDTIVIHGGAKGANTIARGLAYSRGLQVIKVEAQWSIYGRAAGPIRNKAMLDLNPDLIIYFHNDLMGSKGTRNMVEMATQAGIAVFGNLG